MRVAGFEPWEVATGGGGEFQTPLSLIPIAVRRVSAAGLEPARPDVPSNPENFVRLRPERSKNSAN